MNNCVGERNIKFFVLFLSAASTTCLYMVACSVYYLLHNIISDSDAYDNATKYAAMFYVAIGVTIVGAYLIMYRSSTNRNE